MTTRLTLVGGWGYRNLGDEAILAGYLDELQGKWVVEALSVDPRQTSEAQERSLAIVPERAPRCAVRDDSRPLVVAGGGYLNGRWKREIYLKLMRLTRIRASRPLIAHGLEVRHLADGAIAPLARRLFRGAELAVRDEASADEVERLGLVRPAIVPDSIALLVPYLASHAVAIDRLRGCVLVNLLDIGARGDADESGVDVRGWTSFCSALVASLGPRAVGLVVGGGDYRFMKKFPSLPLLEPRTVRQLVSCIGSADAIISVRMHPALIGTALNKPTVAVPYCGKVGLTLDRLGLHGAILPDLSESAVGAILSAPRDDSVTWREANAESRRWLEAALSAHLAHVGPGC